MAVTKDSVVVELRAENAKLKADLNKAKGTVKGFGTSTTAAFKKIGIAAAAAFGTAKIISFVKTGITEFAKFDRSMTQITQKIERAGQGFEGMAEQVETYIRSAEEASRFSKFELAASLDDLLLKTGDYNTALQLNEKAMDLAVAGNISLQTASQALSLAYEGNTSGVSQIARVMGMATEDAKDLNKVFAELEKSTKGVARSEVGMATELDKLNNSLNDGAELIGEEVGPMFVKFARFLVGAFTQSVQFVINLFKTWWVWLKTIGRVIDEVLGPALDWIGEKARVVADGIAKAWSWLTGKIEQATKKISAAAGKSNNKIVGIFKDGAKELKDIWTTSKDEKEALDLEALNNTFALRETDQENKNENAEKDKERAETAAGEELIRREDWSSATIAAGSAVADSLNEFFKSTGESAEATSAAFKKMAKGMFKAIVGAVGQSLIVKGTAKIAEGVAALLGILTAAAAPGLFAGGAKLIGAGAAIKGMSLMLAEGGIVTRPTQALIGEEGPEAVIPLDRAGLLGGPVTIESLTMQFPDVRNVADVQDARFSQSVARQLATGLQEVRRRMGVR